MKTKYFAVVVVMVVIAMVVSGCGGGGGNESSEGSGITLPRLVNGVANIHSDSTNPKVMVIRLSSSDDPTTYTAVGINRSYSGWADRNFSVPVPSTPSSTTIFSLVAVNDVNNNNRYDSSELLGYADCYLVWNNVAEQWQIWNKIPYTLRWSNAFAQGGKDNVFIDAIYERTRASGTTEQLSLDKLAAGAAELEAKLQ